MMSRGKIIQINKWLFILIALKYMKTSVLNRPNFHRRSSRKFGFLITESKIEFLIVVFSIKIQYL